MELHEAKEIFENGEQFKNLQSYMKNYTSSALDTSYDVLRVADAIWTEVSRRKINK